MHRNCHKQMYKQMERYSLPDKYHGNNYENQVGSHGGNGQITLKISLQVGGDIAIIVGDTIWQWCVPELIVEVLKSVKHFTNCNITCLNPQGNWSKCNAVSFVQSLKCASFSFFFSLSLSSKMIHKTVQLSSDMPFTDSQKPLHCCFIVIWYGMKCAILHFNL